MLAQTLDIITRSPTMVGHATSVFSVISVFSSSSKSVVGICGDLHFLHWSVVQENIASAGPWLSTLGYLGDIFGIFFRDILGIFLRHLGIYFREMTSGPGKYCIGI